MQKASDFDLIESYSRLHNVWKVADEFGMCGQSVYERLSKRGIIESNHWTEEEDSLLKELYGKSNNPISLDEIAFKVGRSRAAIACRANQLGITNIKRLANLSEKTKISEFAKERIKNNGHTKGMLGKKHSEKTKIILKRKSKAITDSFTKKDWEKRAEKSLQTKIKNGTLNSLRNRENPYSRTKGGKREDLDNKFFRSMVEANYARYLNFLGHKWEYEPKDFYFDGIRHGTVSFTPDFYDKTTNKWIELKGWFDLKSVTKIKRFKKFYPKEFSKLIIITQSKKSWQKAIELTLNVERYESIAKKCKYFIPNWE